MKLLLLSLIFIGYLPIVHSQIILLDPGHGGDDLGARIELEGRMIYEKDLALSLTKRIKQRLEKRKYLVFMSRSFDRNVSLEERAEMAEKVKADIFISIHFNSALLDSSHGFESYYLDNKRDSAVKKVEDVENRGLRGEDLIVHQILTDLIVEKTVESSRQITSSIHQEIKNKMRPFSMADRGIKAGLFYVLALSKRPGTLLEVGFLSNPKELAKIRRADFQDAYAEAVAKGIDRYFRQIKNSTKKK